ncbi:ShlB/FhaC/HecB family hemolysin secretion/activation protein [Herbaspirillum sp.]|uniref:ShlB/FhaC/HecB family hemolysin secretion/activation protein n=1 Tax=Herbaspirillum sp. TaxID=1890675 RepID=UPI001B0CC2F6|nr:ShlB/FhaC/HecB family hemolysin secretion/activation protein [Herbaspirillum sp.]MBO9537057.1 ShlB/FhaC/HecB family hemolysin secretion/activation protein [Herbaspirillum sp.]
MIQGRRKCLFTVSSSVMLTATLFASPETLAQQPPALIPPNIEQQGIPQIRRDEITPRGADQPKAAGMPTMAEQNLISPIARIDVRSPLLAPEIEALLHSFIGKRRISGEELATARGEIWNMLRHRGRMTRIELNAESISETAGGSVLHADVHDVSVRRIFVEPEPGSAPDQATLNTILADAGSDIAEGGLLDTEKIENRIRRRIYLKDVDLRAVLVPVGIDLVDVKIIVAAKPGMPIGLVAQADNYGGRTYGRNRYTLGISLPDRIVPGDQFDAMTINSANMNYGRLSYEIPVVPLGARLDVSGAIMDYRAPSGEQGRTTMLGAGLSYPLHMGDRSQWIGQLHYQRRQQTDRLESFGNIADKSTDSVRGALGLRYYPSPAQVVYFDPAVTVGRLDLSGLPSALEQDQLTARTNGTFAKLEWEAGWNMLFGPGGKFDARINAMGQWANKNLDQSEKFALGGPRRIRAYGSSEGLGDEGFIFNTELGYRPSQWLRTFSFYSIGRIRRYVSPWAADSIPNRYTLQGAGVGLSVTYGQMVGSLAYSRQIGSNPGLSSNGLDSDGTSDRHRLWFTLTFRQ